jgi:hypothetical protein
MNEIQILQIKVLALNRNVAKQLHVVHFPTPSDFDGAELIGWIAREGIPDIGRTMVLARRDEELTLYPLDHVRLIRPDVALRQIFIA